MGTRRMISKDIVRTDLFLDMPASSQALYFHLVLEADDDGFIGNINSITRTVGSTQNDLTLLINRNLIIRFVTGVVVITDWSLQNSIKKDRYHSTIYQTELHSLTKGVNGKYSLIENADVSAVIDDDKQKGDKLETAWKQNGSIRPPQVSKLSKLSKDNKDILSSKKPLDPIPYEKIINYLNEKANTSYRVGTASTKALIKARFKEGFKVDDFFTVIDKKVNEWGRDSKMVMYLRPQTLFSTKFESYLNQQNKLNYSGLNTDLQEYNQLNF